MTKPTPRDIHRAVEFVKSCPANTHRPAALAHEFAAAREDVLRQFEALAKEWSAQIDWSAKHTPESRPAHGVQACRNDIEEVIAKLREEGT